MSSPRPTLTVVPSLSSPRHSHAGQPMPAPSGTDPRRFVALREFALISRPVARAAGLIDARDELLDHELTPDALRSMAFATVKDRTGDDDALETRAPALVAEKGWADAVAAQLNHGRDMGIGDLTYWIEADDLPDSPAASALALSLAA